MAMTCDICGKRQMAGNQISHSNIKTRRRQRPNVQKIRGVVEGRVVRVHACTRCIRTGRITKAA